MIRTKRMAPAAIRHEWYRKKGTERGVYECPHCKAWTANVPEYYAEACPARDRRTRKQDRRKGDPHGE